MADAIDTPQRVPRSRSDAFTQLTPHKLDILNTPDARTQKNVEEVSRQGWYQEVFVEHALVVAALPADGVEIRQGVARVLHALEGRDGVLLRAERMVLRDARQQRWERRGAGRRGRVARGVLREQRLEQGVGGVGLADLERHCRRAAGAQQQGACVFFTLSQTINIKYFKLASRVRAGRHIFQRHLLNTSKKIFLLNMLSEFRRLFIPVEFCLLVWTISLIGRCNLKIKHTVEVVKERVRYDAVVPRHLF